MLEKTSERDVLTQEKKDLILVVSAVVSAISTVLGVVIALLNLYVTLCG